MKKELQKLIAKYESERDHYLSSEYNEAQLRIDFLDPFFELLGWDIANKRGKPTNEREVLLEESLKEEKDAHSKKPDYTFRLYSERKYYVEAKKPSVDISTDIDSSKQIRRYGFTAKLKISVLSNFEHLAVYDCSHKVEKDDQVSKARVKIYHYTEYLEAIDDIQKQLSHDSVYSGEFDIVWEHIEDQLRSFSVDSLFVRQINDWRLILGREIFEHKPDLSQSELNDIVQRYINSIIFLRVCEDRDLEEYKTLLSFASKDDFKSLVQKFSEADKKYNAGLFNHPLTDQIITQNKSAFWSIIQQLYYPESTYSFAVFASDILGSIYEIFLGEQIVIQDNQVTLEKKPENEDRDIVATPTHVIQDLLRKTVASSFANKTDEKILSSKIADIACGSGAFLLEAFQLVNDILIDYYLNNDPKKLVPVAVNSYKLAFDDKRKILEQCMYGVDKDFNAVQACKFGLLLKLLEDEQNSTIPIPALPTLEKSINFGNSLIESSDTSAENRREINPFDFGSTKFDVIIGNPPYMSTEDMNQITPLELPIYRSKYNTSYKQFDKYFLFIERGYMLLKSGGLLGFIAPSKFAKVGAGKKLREMLRNDHSISELISFGSIQIFKDRTTYTCLLILQKNGRESFDYLEVEDLTDWRVRKINESDVNEINISDLDDDGWVLIPSCLKEVYDDLNEQSISLEDMIGADNIYNGIQTSANDVYVHSIVREDNSLVYFQKDGREWSIEKTLTRPYFKTSSGNDNLYTYRLLKPNAFVIYPYIKNLDGNIEFVEIGVLERDYPNAFEYLSEHKDQLSRDCRDINPEPETEDEWYRFGRHQSLEKCDVPAKIVVGVLSKGDKYALDLSHTLISSGGTAGYNMITLPEDTNYSIYYIQALLNSKYLEWHSSLMGEVFRGGYIARGTKILKRLPIRQIDFDSESDKKLHDEISNLQESLIGVQNNIDLNANNERERVVFERGFASLKQQLNGKLADLYDLGEKDGLIPVIT